MALAYSLHGVEGMGHERRGYPRHNAPVDDGNVVMVAPRPVMVLTFKERWPGNL
jgi:hypothetical protein